jgi:hypothetical protein
MKYLLLQDNNYYFRRKLPKTSQSFTFSLKSKNAKIAYKVISLFLIRAEPLFQLLKIEKREDIVSNLETIIKLLEDYKNEALIEYSSLERERHKALSCISKSGKKRDGGHSKCIKKWLKIYKEAVFSCDDKIEQYFKEILGRTGISETFLKGLSSDERMQVTYRVVKTEKEVLQEDYDRSQSFKAGSKQNNQVTQPIIQMPQSNKYYEKTAQELADEFIAKKKNDTTELHKYSAPIEVFLKVVETKYLADISAEKMTDFIFVTKHLLPQTKKESKVLHKKYKDTPMELAQYVIEKKLETITLRTAMEKIKNVGSFLQYAIDMERLDINRLSKNPNLPSRKEKEKRNEVEEEIRTPFTTEELNKLFKSSWYSKNLHNNLKKGQDKIYIPLIALMGGMRLTEISQLYVNDIKEEDGIFYFRVDKLNLNQKLKNTSAKRNIPIHPKLIELGFLKYIDMLKIEKVERVFYQLGENKRGYGTPFGKKFSNKIFRSEWLNLKEIEEKNETKVFHNFRHNFITKVKQTSKPYRTDALVGHKLQNYKYEHPELKDLSEVMNELNYDDIDFSHIQRAVDTLYN